MPVPDYEAGRRQVGALFLSVSSHQSSKERGRAEGLNGDNERASVRRQNGFLKQVRNHKTKLWVFEAIAVSGTFTLFVTKNETQALLLLLNRRTNENNLCGG